jgi:thiosulfate/3-mercaptopyruvate sulfurtransferase
MSLLPFLVEPDQLQQHLGEADDNATPGQAGGLLIIDMRAPEHYAAGHIAGAVNLSYAGIVRSDPPVGGLLPGEEQLSAVLSAIGLSRHHHVVAYDGEGGGHAGRLLWTLDALGHSGLSLLNGGIVAWQLEGGPLKKTPVKPIPGHYQAKFSNSAVVADKNYIRSRLGQPDFQPLDARTPAEFRGQDVRAARGGHIPGAVNLNWVDAIDRERALRFKADDELRSMLEQLGATPDKEVVAYCHTHHRSSHTYTVLKHLGYHRLRGYPGSWSDWGNDPDTPVET